MGWTIKPSEFNDLLATELSDFQKKVAAELLNRVIKRSPVDTGLFRQNHHVSIGSPDTGVVALGRGGIQIGLSAIAGIPKGQYPLIYIQNNLPYSEALENGSSKQAPLGIYSLAFQDVQANLKAGK